MTIRISLSQHGRSFATRGRGEELRQQVLADAEQAESIVLDLAGVENVSYSFADEFLGRLHMEASVPVLIEGARPTVQRTVDDAIRRRATVASSA